MSLVGRAAHRVAHEYHAVTEIDRIQHSRQNADVGLRSGDDETIRFTRALAVAIRRRPNSCSCR
jgi:hypothetical protein